MIETHQILELLQDSRIFSSLDHSQSQWLADNCEQKSLAAADVLFKQSERGDSAYLVTNGSLSVEVQTDINAVVVATIAKGDVVGEIAALSQIPRNATVRAIEHSTVAIIHRDQILKIIESNPIVSGKIIAELGKHLAHMNESMALVVQSVESLRAGRENKELLNSLHSHGDKFSQFATVFKDMAAELDNKNSLRYELDMARKIQNGLLPNLASGVPDPIYDIHAKMVAARNIGGDFYDVIQINDNIKRIIVGDVSGKGAPAALFMAFVRTILKTLTRNGTSIQELLHQTSSLISEDNDNMMFVTLFIGDLDNNRRTLTYCNAGHEPAYLKRADSSIQELESSLPALGISDPVNIQPRTLNLLKGDVVLVYTDGVTDAINEHNEPFGEARLVDLFQSTQELSAHRIVDIIMGAVDLFSGETPRFDDTNCLVISVTS